MQSIITSKCIHPPNFVWCIYEPLIFKFTGRENKSTDSTSPVLIHCFLIDLNVEEGLQDAYSSGIYSRNY